jgi:putative DNA primase/helicase
MRADIFQFKPSHKLWMYGNYKPVIRGADDGIWRRIHLIPFTAFIAPEDRIPHMMELLIDEASGILNWAIEGHLKYQKEGLSMPSEVSKAVSEYREDMDTLGEWITDNTNRVKGHRSSIADIYDNYIAWCLMNDETSLSKKHLVQRITERGYNKCRMPDGSRGLLDIELRI